MSEDRQDTSRNGDHDRRIRQLQQDIERLRLVNEDLARQIAALRREAGTPVKT